MRLEIRRREPPQQPDLARVIEVVRRRAANHVQGGAPFLRLRAKRLRQIQNDAAEVVMLGNKQPGIPAPRSFAALKRPLEKVAALQRKAAALLAREFPPHDV